MRELPDTTTRAGLSRRAALIGVALCMIAQGAGVAHLTFVHHAICVDHGELVDVVAQSAVTPDPDDGMATKVGLHLPGRATLAGADEHCSLAQLVRQVMPSVSAPVLLARPPCWREREPARSAADARLSLLRLAPKQSPPASAA